MKAEELEREDYREYLERHKILGEGQPKLSLEEYDRLDDEVLDLLALVVSEVRLTPEQEERLRELESILLLDEGL